MAAPTAAFTVIPLSDVDPDSPITTTLMDSLRLNDQNLFAQIVGDPVTAPTFTAAAEHNHDGVNSKVVAGNDFILIEKKVITSDVTTVSFVGLAGETDEMYKIVGRIIDVALGGDRNYELHPNGISGSGVSRTLEWSGATPTVITSASQLVLARGGGTGSDDVAVFEAFFYARRTVNSIVANRNFISHYTGRDNSNGLQPASVGGQWANAATITSLDIVSAAASKIGDGSAIALYRLRQ